MLANHWRLIYDTNMTEDNKAAWLDEVRWNSDGLVPAISQDQASGCVLTLAWMNRAALAETAKQGRAVFWSRSRQALWHKGEVSGHVQWVEAIRLDCDKDAILLSVTQAGGIACHTGRQSCFFSRLEGRVWQDVDPVLKAPDEIYPAKK